MSVCVCVCVCVLFVRFFVCDPPWVTRKALSQYRWADGFLPAVKSEESTKILEEKRKAGRERGRRRDKDSTLTRIARIATPCCVFVEKVAHKRERTKENERERERNRERERERGCVWLCCLAVHTKLLRLVARYESTDNHAKRSLRKKTIPVSRGLPPPP